jgi:hypothetical protein
MPIIVAIPPQYNDGFKELGELSNEEFEVLKKCLSEAPYFSSLEKLSDFVLFNDDSGINCENIFESIGSLYEIVEAAEVKGEVSKDIATISEELNQLGKSSKEEYENRVKYLLENEQIYYAYKAQDLSYNYDNVFIKTKIVTDIRPIFNLSIEAPTKGMILHNLSIHYQPAEQANHKDINIVLNSKDIKTLQDVLSRAEKKEAALKKLFNSAFIENLTE